MAQVDYTTTKIVTTPVTMSAVSKLLGVITDGLNAICKCSKINMWAKYKPYNGTLIFDDDRTGLQNRNYGIKIQSNTDGTMEWTWDKPTGGASSPYRLADFRNYYHKAKPQYYVQVTGPCSQQSVNIDGVATLEMDIKKTLLDDENAFSVSLIDRQVADNGYLKDYCIQNSDVQYLKNYTKYFFALNFGTSWLAYKLSNQNNTGIYAGSGSLGKVDTSNEISVIIQTGVASTDVVSNTVPDTWLPPACITPYITIKAHPRGVFYQASVTYNEDSGVGLYVTSKGTITDDNGTIWEGFFVTAIKFGGSVIPVSKYDQDYLYKLNILLGDDSQSTNVGIILASQISSSGSETVEQQKKRLLAGSSIFGARAIGTKSGTHTGGSGQCDFDFEDDLTTANGIWLYAKKTIVTGNKNMAVVPGLSAMQSNKEIDSITFGSKTFDVSSLQYYWNNI